MSLAGFRDITSIDYSPTVISAMSAKYPRDQHPALKWSVMDMTTLSPLAPSSFLGSAPELPAPIARNTPDLCRRQPGRQGAARKVGWPALGRNAR